ncbi:MAG: PLP-dependent aminotransferase family protein [Ruminococcaceae bacterium]|nr:PLP-dependent aminotransferase family protein [Oscillospiraceae bacterium]
MQKNLAERVKPLEASAIREIFKMIGKADIISFAGGIPSPETYPSEELARIAADILKNTPNAALQYGVTEGYAPLVAQVKAMNAKAGIGGEMDETVITTGAQQAIDLAAKSLLNPGDGVIVEKPSFIGTLNSLRSYEAKLYDVPLEADGMDLARVEELLKTENIKLIYTIPTFQNPTGITMPLEKRKKLLALAQQYNCMILEDNPYGDLRFRGEAVPTIKSMDTEGRVIYVGTFSKTLAPGLRVGFITAHRELVDRVVVVKQVNDVHTTQLAQMIVSRFMEENDMDAHVAKGCEICKAKCDLMLSCMDEYFPENVEYTRPDGGIFLWVTLPEGIDTKELFKKSVERKVAFVPGSTSMVDLSKPTNCFRLNYTTMPDEKIREGIRILGDLLKEELA